MSSTSRTPAQIQANVEEISVQLRQLWNTEFENLKVYNDQVEEVEEGIAEVNKAIYIHRKKLLQLETTNRNHNHPKALQIKAVINKHEQELRSYEEMLMELDQVFQEEKTSLQETMNRLKRVMAELSELLPEEGQ